jgi:hypothetical protein
VSGLLDRIRANRCGVIDCDRERRPDARFCGDDLNADLRGELVQQPDKTFVRRRFLPARDLTAQLRGVA